MLIGQVDFQSNQYYFEENKLFSFKHTDFKELYYWIDNCLNFLIDDRLIQSDHKPLCSYTSFGFTNDTTKCITIQEVNGQFQLSFNVVEFHNFIEVLYWCSLRIFGIDLNIINITYDLLQSLLPTENNILLTMANDDQMVHTKCVDFCNRKNIQFSLELADKMFLFFKLYNENIVFTHLLKKFVMPTITSE